MEDTPKRLRNPTLIIGLSIPVLMIAFIASAIYLPRWFTTVPPPQIDFLYAVGDHHGAVHYLVRGARLVREERPSRDDEPPPEPHVQFFIHDVQANRSREITLEDALSLGLDGSALSEDGYRLERGRRGGWFPFDYHYDYRRWFLVSGHYSEELALELDADGAYRYGSFRFLGWVMDS